MGPADLAQTARRPTGSASPCSFCYLRHPGRPLEPCEAPPPSLLQVLAGQLGCEPGTFADYAGRETTLREHRAEIEAWLGLRGFERGEVIVGAMTRLLRGTRIVLPAASTPERDALVARAQARRQAFAGLIRDLSPDQVQGLDDLLSAGSVPGRTAMAWLREWPEASSAANLKGGAEAIGARPPHRPGARPGPAHPPRPLRRDRTRGRDLSAQHLSCP